MEREHLQRPRVDGLRDGLWHGLVGVAACLGLPTQRLAHQADEHHRRGKRRAVGHGHARPDAGGGDGHIFGNKRSSLAVREGVCTAPAAWATSLHLLYPAVFSVEVSASSARWGDTITVDVSGALGIPKGNLLVYLHPEGQDMPLWGSVSTFTTDGRVYPLYATFLEKTSVEHISHHIQIIATLEGHICDMWIDGEGCSPRTLPNGRYQIGVLVPSPFHPGHNIHVPGPMLSITE